MSNFIQRNKVYNRAVSENQEGNAKRAEYSIRLHIEISSIMFEPFIGYEYDDSCISIECKCYKTNRHTKFIPNYFQNYVWFTFSLSWIISTKKLRRQAERKSVRKILCKVTYVSNKN